MLDENHEDLEEKLEQLLTSKNKKNSKIPSKVKEIIPKIEEPQFKVDVKPESQVNVESSSKSTKKRTVMQKLKSISKSKNN
uniref:Uncharacterized protein n=1 Tax=Trichogramma kaykai TaxID=54128 RepID=A0ABD2XNT2_9HYME